MDKSLTEKDSLDLITRMIQNTKNNVRSQGHLYILWGLTVPLAALLHYYFLYNPMGFPPGMVWPVIMTISGILHGVFIAKLTGGQKVVTHLDETMKYLWIGFVLAILAIIAVMIGQGPVVANPMFLIVYGIGTFASGGILGINSLKFGGVFCFVLGGVAAFVGAEIQLLLLAAGAIAGFLIPGIIIYNSRTEDA